MAWQKMGKNERENTLIYSSGEKQLFESRNKSVETTCFEPLHFLGIPVLEFVGTFLEARLYILDVPIAWALFCILALALLCSLLLALVGQVALALPHISLWALECTPSCHRTLLFEKGSFINDVTQGGGM